MMGAGRQVMCRARFTARAIPLFRVPSRTPFVSRKGVKARHIEHHLVPTLTRSDQGVNGG